MISAGYEIREQDPFQGEKISIGNKNVSPYVARMHLLWDQMRKPIIEHFPKPMNIAMDIKQYLQNVEEQYVADAYHSLSIEGYQVSIELIDKIRTGNWNPDMNETDRNHRNALAARGYWQAFQSVKNSIEKVLLGENSGKVAWRDHGDWFRELFAPSVVSGILKPLVSCINHVST